MSFTTVEKAIKKHLAVIYPSAALEDLARQIAHSFGVSGQYRGRAKLNSPWSQKDVVLITYADTLSEEGVTPLSCLEKFLTDVLEKEINTVHILPFFPFSSDDGFAVKDYRKVRSDLGGWSDIASIAKSFSLMSDVVINHISSHHPWFYQFLENRKPGSEFIKTCASEKGLDEVIRPRSTPLLYSHKTLAGDKLVWCTFGPDQVDLDFSNPQVLLEFVNLIRFYIDMGVRLLRLDAIGFLWKRTGTSCLNLKETHEIVRLLRTLVDSIDERVLLVTETNVPSQENLEYFGNGDEAHIIYNFSLSPLILHALLSGDSTFLKRWMMTTAPTSDNCTILNFTASHDGIGLRPLEGILQKEDVSKMVELAKEFGGEVSTRDRHGVETPYELNITFYDMLKGSFSGIDDYQMERFIASQTIMMSVEGIPAFYIQSLFGSKNDDRRMRQTGQKRAINRQQWNLGERQKKLDDLSTEESKVFRELKRRIKIRKEQPAFHPDATQFTLQLPNYFFGFWRQSLCRKQSLFVILNLTTNTVDLDLSRLNLFQNSVWRELLSDKVIDHTDGAMSLNAYQTVWISNGG